VRVKAIDKTSGFFSVNGHKQDSEKTEAVSVSGSIKMAAILRDELISAAQ
jgi:hypothetical protein